MKRKEKLEQIKAAVIAGKSIRDGKSPGLIVKIILAVVIGVVLHDTVKIFAMMNTETPGASKDFADSATKGLRDYCREYPDEECRKSLERLDSGLPVNEDAEANTQRLIRESEALREKSKGLSEALDEYSDYCRNEPYPVAGDGLCE